MKIERYSNQYQKLVKELVISIHEEFGFSYDFKLDYDLEDLEKFYTNSGDVFFILLDNNKLVGTVAIRKIDKESAELKRMYLLKEYRGQGWGSKLIDRAIEFCKEKGFKKIILDTNIKQVAAQKLYQKKGFEIIQTKENSIFMSLKF